MRNLIRAATLIVAVTAGAAHAQENIKIGLITPLTGNSARVGQQAKAAVELGAEIVNGVYPEFATLPLAASAGSPNLKGAKLKIITAVTRATPRSARSKQYAWSLKSKWLPFLEHIFPRSRWLQPRSPNNTGFLGWLGTAWPLTSPSAASNGLSGLCRTRPISPKVTWNS